MIGARRAMAAAGREVPLQVQVTMETTGRMLLGTEIGAALTALDALRPDVIGLNCATGPAEMSEHLRHLAAARPHADLVPPQRRPAVASSTASMHYDLTPEAARRAPRPLRRPSSASTSSAAAAAPRPSTCAAVVERCRGPRRRRPARPMHEPGATSIYSPVPVRAGHLVPHHRRAHQRQRLEEVPRGDARGRLGHLRADGQGAGQGGRPRARRVRRLRRPRRHRRHGRARPPLRHPGRRVPLVLDSTEPPVIEAGLQRLGGRAILNSANLEDGEAAGSRLDRVFMRWPASTAPPSSACSSTRRARPATSSGSCGSPTASTTSPSSATASSPAT